MLAERPYQICIIPMVCPVPTKSTKGILICQLPYILISQISSTEKKSIGIASSSSIITKHIFSSSHLSQKHAIFHQNMHPINLHQDPNRSQSPFPLLMYSTTSSGPLKSVIRTLNVRKHCASPLVGSPVRVAEAEQPGNSHWRILNGGLGGIN